MSDRFTFGPFVVTAIRDLTTGFDSKRNPPQKLAGRCVCETVDYAAGVDGLPKADVFELRLEGGGKLIVRPSGTEPKIKYYLEVTEKERELCESRFWI